ncbi:MAG: hypothetical protein LC777_11620 [Actinobacteria bacterium]|nr:hypothetical protein [Actinomycetota bacterium]
MNGRGEQGWQPINMLPTIECSIDRGRCDTRQQYATLLQARPRPHVLGDALIAGTKRVDDERAIAMDLVEAVQADWVATNAPHVPSTVVFVIMGCLNGQEAQNGPH